MSKNDTSTEIYHALSPVFGICAVGRKKTVETSEHKALRARHAILVRASRTALGFSQREFAELVGVHYSSLARFETGQLRLKPSHIESITAFLMRSGLKFDISQDIGINIEIPIHVIGAMETIDGIKLSREFYQADIIGL